jgi:DNA-binding NtrC family response regulator
MTLKSVYVVDDAQTARDIISIALKKTYHVKSFPSAETAIDAMISDPPDLVLLDIGLPGINGIEALVQIKRLYPDMIVIMMSAYQGRDIMERGFEGFIQKPFNMNELLEKLRGILN